MMSVISVYISLLCYISHMTTTFQVKVNQVNVRQDKNSSKFAKEYSQVPKGQIQKNGFRIFKKHRQLSSGDQTDHNKIPQNII